jgi:hypothetical protein
MLVVQCCAAQYVDIEKKHKNRTTYFDTDMGIMGISVHITYEVLYTISVFVFFSNEKACPFIHTVCRI